MLNDRATLSVIRLGLRILSAYLTLDDMPDIYVAISDKNQQQRQAVISQFINTEIQVVAETEEGNLLLTLLEDCRPDIVMVDTKLSNPDCFSLVKTINTLYPHIKIIIITKFFLEEDIMKINSLRLNAFISEKEGTDFCELIRMTHIGSAHPREKITLSDFELRLIKAMSAGKKTKELASLFQMNVRAIASSRQRLYKKFNVVNKQELVAEAYRRRILS